MNSVLWGLTIFAAAHERRQEQTGELAPTEVHEWQMPQLSTAISTYTAAAIK
jgi:hypothetical protein